eukprot:Selendium_serpulae@DN5682_c1_g1_i4.p1
MPHEWAWQPVHRAASVLWAPCETFVPLFVSDSPLDVVRVSVCRSGLSKRQTSPLRRPDDVGRGGAQSSNEGVSKLLTDCPSRRRRFQTERDKGRDLRLTWILLVHAAQMRWLQHVVVCGLCLVQLNLNAQIA